MEEIMIVRQPKPDYEGLIIAALIALLLVIFVTLASCQAVR